MGPGDKDDSSNPNQTTSALSSDASSLARAPASSNTPSEMKTSKGEMDEEIQCSLAESRLAL